MKHISLPGAGAAIAALLLSFSCNQASACATCFGQTDSALGRGLNWGIFALLVVVGGVLAAISSFFVFVARRAARIEAETAAGAPQSDASNLSKTV